MDAPILVSTKSREVWTHENKRKLDRLCDMLLTARVKLRLRCDNPVCPDPDIKTERDETDPGGRVLACGCTRRFLEHRPSRRTH